MKTKNQLFHKWSLAICITLLAINTTKADEKTAPTKQSHSVSLLLIGLSGQQITSNCISNDEFAHEIGTTEEQLDNYLSDYAKRSFETNAKNNDFQIIDGRKCAELVEKLVLNIEENEVKYDLGNVSQPEFTQILENRQCRYVIVMEQYNITQQGYPYNNIQHELTFSVYNQKKEKLKTLNHQFTSLSKINQVEFDRQLKKAARKTLNIVK